MGRDCEVSVPALTPAVLDVEQGTQVTLRSPRLNRFEQGGPITSSAVTGELITVDTI